MTMLAALEPANNYAKKWKQCGASHIVSLDSLSAASRH